MKSSEKGQNNKPIAHGVGRRKSSVARVWLKRGKGDITVNHRDYKDYFYTMVSKLAVNKPFSVLENKLNYNVQVNVNGGGLKGQADAIKLAIARALLKTDEELRSVLREHNLLTVDSRLKERKKYGQRGARRKFQFVKR